MVSFAAHVHNMSQYITRAKLRGWLYNRYETLMMTLETLQGRYRVQMKHNAGLEFETGHNKVNIVPFKLEMSNLTTTLTSWAKDLHMDVSRGTITGIHYVGSDKKCWFCDIPVHTG
jgi:hypothetical protein